MVVDRRAQSHARVDVGDRDVDLHSAAGQRFRNGELIEITRSVVVDRSPKQATQIADIGSRADRRRDDGARLGQHRGREFRKKAVFDHGLAGDGLERGRGGHG